MRKFEIFTAIPSLIEKEKENQFTIFNPPKEKKSR